MLSRADELAAQNKPYQEVYAAMAESLGEAWKDLYKQLEHRKHLLDQSIAFHESALQVCALHPLELAKICETVDIEPFKKVINDCNHVLYDLLPSKKMHDYNLRTRPHQHVLPIKNVHADKNFLDRMLHVDMY